MALIRIKQELPRDVYSGTPLWVARWDLPTRPVFVAYDSSLGELLGRLQALHAEGLLPQWTGRYTSYSNSYRDRLQTYMARQRYLGLAAVLNPTEAEMARTGKLYWHARTAEGWLTRADILAALR